MGLEKETVKATKTCHQGGVLSPLMWSLVMDDLLYELGSEDFEVVGYADYLVFMVRGKDDRTVSEWIQIALDMTDRWCRRQGLNMNPSNTVLVPFPKNRKNNLMRPSLSGTILNFASEVKYLGVILDSKLTWNNHIQNLKMKATKALMACNSLVGKKWGLKPRIVY